jgi:hypothetical protein
MRALGVMIDLFSLCCNSVARLHDMKLIHVG